MRIAYIAAGAGGMYCGSCIHDNTLATALIRRGVEVALIPTYTPLRTDEKSVSRKRVFYGGINVFLQEKLGMFRHTPRVLDWFLDRPALLRWVASAFSATTSAENLGALTVSVLKGEGGHQRKELRRLSNWIRGHYRPDLVQLTNSMFVGTARFLKKEVGKPVLCAVQGEELFLDGLNEPYRSDARSVLKDRARDVDGFIAPCRYYADFMADYLDVESGKFHVVKLGVNLSGCGKQSRHREEGQPFRIGYLARLAPEKGLHLLIEAFHKVVDRAARSAVRLEIAGWLGAKERSYYDAAVERIGEFGLDGSFVYHGEVNRAEKIRFLQSLDVLSVPATYGEPKGLYVLEALANGVPVVEPRHGAFPELIEQTGGGILVEPNSASSLADGLLELLHDEQRRVELGRRGKAAVERSFSDEVMAEETMKVYEQYV